MSVLVQSFIPGMSSDDYDERSAKLLPMLRSFDGFLGLHAAAFVEGGLQITETWSDTERYRSWIEDVVATTIPAGAVSQMQTSFTPLYDLMLAGEVVHA